MVEKKISTKISQSKVSSYNLVDLDVVDLRVHSDASMPASNNNVNYTVYSNF